MNDQPLFFDPNGKGGRILPTVYTLWAIPEAMPRGIVTYGEVSPEGPGRRGPDVAGFITSDEEFDGDGETSQWARDVVRGGRRLGAARARAHPHAFAIGEMAVSKAEAEACGMKGRGLKVMHHYPEGTGDGGTSPRRANRFARRARGPRVNGHSSPGPDEAPREAHEATDRDAPTTRLETLRLSDDDDRGVEAAPQRRRRRG